MVKVPGKTDVMSHGKVAVDAGIGAVITGISANVLGGALGILVGSIVGGAAVGGDTGKMVTVNGVQDSITAMMLGGMGEVGEGGAVM